MICKTAFLYDFLLVKGGAEKTALHLKQVYPEIDMIFGFIDRAAFPESQFPDHEYQSLSSPSHVVGWQGIKAMAAFRRKASFLHAYNTVIYAGLYAPIAVQHHLNGRNIYYCHTPPRFVYDLRDYYLEAASAWQRPLLKSLILYLQPRYEQSIAQMDVVIANSVNVKNRLERYLGISNVCVIHPPVDTSRFSWREQGDYYLSTARLEPYKRVDLVIKAFAQCPEKRLVVASGGRELSRLRTLAAECSNISFVGWCSEEELQRLIGGCIATIYMPLDEDFGISPVESMTAGKPVIGVAQGGLLETVVANETGILIEPSSLENADDDGHETAIDAVVEAMRMMDKATALSMRTACENRAAHFSSRVFDKKFSALLSQ